MLAKADQYGEIQCSVPGLARAALVSREECDAALEIFSSPDPDSRSKEHDGRRIEDIDGGWRLLNHSKYRGMMSREERNQKRAAYMRDYRKRPRDSTLLQVEQADQKQIRSDQIRSRSDPDPENHNTASDNLENINSNETIPEANGCVLPKPSGVKPSEKQKRKENTTERHDGAIPANLEEALCIPIHQRCSLLVQRPDLAGWLQPSVWPEISSVISLYRGLTGQPNLPIGRYDKDGGLRAVVALFSTEPEIPIDDIHAALRRLVSSEYWRRVGIKRGLQGLTIEVIRRELIPITEIDRAELPRKMFSTGA